jgi:GAF domain
MSEHRYWRRRAVDRVIDQLRRSNSPPRNESGLRGVPGFSEEKPAALKRLLRDEQQRRMPRSDSSGSKPEARATDILIGHRSPGEDAMTRALKLAHAETQMDVAMLGEVCDGREVVRYLAGDGDSFGLSPGASMPIEDTYCHRLLTGRLSNVVPDAQADEQLRNLEITRAAHVGAYIGVPLTGPDARLYVLCGLAHEQRPQLGQRDVVFLRGLGQAVLAALS